MYSYLPPRQQVFIRIALSSAWALTAIGGMAALLFPPPFVLDLLELSRGVAGATLAVTASLAAVGVAFDRYRLEWVAAWFSAAALAPYTLVYWYSVFTVDITRMSAALLLTALLAFYVARAIMCSAHAERLRMLHEGVSGDDQ